MRRAGGVGLKPVAAKDGVSAAEAVAPIRSSGLTDHVDFPYGM